MTTKNIFEFLESCDLAALKKDGVITNKDLLQGDSVNPLIELMKETGISKLEFPDSDWFLDANGYFSNLKYGKNNKGYISDLIPSERGRVFMKQNRFINPYFNPSTVEAE